MTLFNEKTDIARHVEQWHEQGFTVVSDIVRQPEIARLRAAVDEALDADWERYRGLPGKERFIALDLAQYGGPFLDLLDDDGLDSLFGAILGPRWVLYSFTSTVALAKTEQYTANIHTDTFRWSPDYDLGAVMTVALDDFTSDNGATYYLPGSHLTHRDPPSEEEFYDGAVRVVRKAGDAVFFHPRVWHAGGHNQTDRTRSGLTVYGCRSFMKQRLDFPRLLEPAMLDGVGERVRRILGFDVRVPTSMGEFYRPPDQRLYKGGQG